MGRETDYAKLWWRKTDYANYDRQSRQTVLSYTRGRQTAKL